MNDRKQIQKEDDFPEKYFLPVFWKVSIHAKNPEKKIKLPKQKAKSSFLKRTRAYVRVDAHRFVSEIVFLFVKCT